MILTLKHDIPINIQREYSFSSPNHNCCLISVSISYKINQTTRKKVLNKLRFLISTIHHVNTILSLLAFFSKTKSSVSVLKYLPIPKQRDWRQRSMRHWGCGAASEALASCGFLISVVFVVLISWRYLRQMNRGRCLSVWMFVC